MSDSWRGNPIFKENGTWFYRDGVKVEIDPIRNCGHCGLDNRKDGCDRCLGRLSGVLNACCGHGNRDSSYIQFEGGVVVRGFLVTESGGEDEREGSE